MDILEGVKEQPVKIPKKYMLERETVKNGIKYQKMIAKSAKIVFNNLNTQGGVKMEITLNVTLLTALCALLLTGGIFLFAFQAFLLKGVNAMLDAKTDSLKENQGRLEKNQVRLESNQVRIEKELGEFKLEVRTFQKEVNSKLDKLVSNTTINNK